MEKFAKSILNYFATYTETRFNFQKKIDYKWTDDRLTAEFSVFSEFQKKILNTIRNKEPFQFSVRKGEYAFSLDPDNFKKEILQKLETNYSLDFLKSCLKQSYDKLIKTESDKIIIAGHRKSQETEVQIKPNKDFERKVLQEGIRVFNLALRKAVQEILIKLQKQKRDELLRELNITSAPYTSFNPHTVEQEIYDLLQEKSHKTTNEESFFSEVRDIITNKSWNLEMYDLYSTIRRFTAVLSVGTPYMFFQEISFEDGGMSPADKYPLFLIELDIDEKNEEIILKSNRNVLLINTPAINSFGFDNILTTPRAARLIEANEYLFGVERFLQNSYDYYEPFLLEYAFKPLTTPNRPAINYRIGLQCIQKENRKLLDYSELITRIDAGQGGKFIDFVKNYVSGNVENTTEEVDSAYNRKYPRKSANNLLSTIPIGLNKTQKRIITAIENPKNKIVVVDGPPGTGKSYAIAAITYWANQQNKSVVITSHKKAALDVLDRMLTDKFRKLHPKAKPSVMRITQDESGINTSQNTLSGPVISAANNRVNDFNEDAVRRDIENWQKIVTEQVDTYWNNAKSYKEFIDKLLRYEEIGEALRASGIIKNEMILPKLDKAKTIDIQLIRECAEQVEKSKIDSFSIEQLSALYEKRDLIEDRLNACNIINSSSIRASDIKYLRDFDSEAMEYVLSLISELGLYLKEKYPVFVSSGVLRYKFLAFLSKKKEKINTVNACLNKLSSLEFEDIIFNISQLSSKDKSALTIKDLKAGVEKLKEIKIYKDNIKIINAVKEELCLQSKDIKEIYNFLSSAKNIISCVKQETISSLQILQANFSDFLKNAGIEPSNLKELRNVFTEEKNYKNILDYILLFLYLSKNEYFDLPDQSLISDYYISVQKHLENINDKRLKNFNKHAGDIERILVTLKSGKRLKPDELNVLLKNISCIISEPDLISQYFPMEEDVIDILVIDEASQVSIAESISLILRAKQVVVFGDELQYGAVGAVNVNKAYAEQYFREILDSYESDYKISFDLQEKEKLSKDVSEEVDIEEQEIEPVFYKPEEGTIDWLKTFSIRTSTLNFAKAIKNYSTSLDTHFRSFPEIIDYSNEIFYKPSQIPLIVNRIRTKPINEVLRFMKVDTQGNSGNNVNLDEIESIKHDIQNIISNGFKGTIGIITSFREQKNRMEEVLRKELPNFHYLEKDLKLTIWFVGDVQGEERDIVYYSFVEDKKIGNGSLRNIYPIIGGSADNIRKLKMQRLNVGFSRAKDTMVFVHSMPIEDYSDTRLGDALKRYKQLLDTANDNFIADESVFGSPAEKDLYTLIINTEFYRQNRGKIKIIAQFPIGRYIEETLHKYIPKYRVDFLMTLSDKGKEKSLILEYDGLEYHTKNPEIVTAHNFSQEYLDYDIERQLELESYGYNFMRINKFTLIPKDKIQTKIDVLNSLLAKKFKD